MVLHGGSLGAWLAASARKGPAGGMWSTVLWGDLCSLAEAKLSGFWQLVVDEKRQTFTSEKFLLLASEEGE